MPAQRRKIFPHLDNDKKEKDNYDNAKSSKVHPSARKDKNSKTTNPKSSITSSNNANNGQSNKEKEVKTEAPTHHLLPLPLVFIVILCSGLFWISSFRDMMATGKPILDSLGVLWGQSDADANLLVSEIMLNAFSGIQTSLV